MLNNFWGTDLILNSTKNKLFNTITAKITISKQNSSNQNSSNQNSSNQNSLNQNSLNQNSLNQNSSNQNSLNQNSLNQNSLNQKDIFKIVKKRIEIVLNNNKTVLRARFSTLNTDSYYYANEKSKDLVKEIVNISNHKLNKLQIGKKLVESNMSAIIFIHKNNIYIGATHSFFDGLSLLGLIGYCLDEKIINYKMIPKFEYYPIITETITLKYVPKILNNILLLPRNLSIKDNNEMKKIIKYEKITNIKEIKNYFNNKYNDFSFTSTITLILSVFIFENINKNKLKVNIIVGFKQSTIVFNNISIITIILHKSENWSYLSVYDKFISIADQINTAMKTYAKSQINLIYTLNNIYNLPYFLNNDSNVNSPDLIITGCKVKKGTFNKNPIKISFDHISISAPCYIGYINENSNIKFQIYNNSHDIKNYTKSLQIKQLLHNL